MNPTLLPMDIRQAARIAELQATLDPSPWNENQWAEAIEQYPSGWVLVEPQRCEQILGYVIYQVRVDPGDLLNLGIAQACQGKGYAEGLMQSTVQLLPAGIETLFLEVRRSNLPAIGLYEKLGFELVAERRDYYPFAGSVREDALVYKKSL